MSGYRPVRVIQAGTIRFEGRRIHFYGWQFDLAGRAPRPDWARAYADEIALAVQAYLADLVHCFVHQQEVSVDFGAVEEANRLIANLRVDRCRPWWRRWP